MGAAMKGVWGALVWTVALVSMMPSVFAAKIVPIKGNILVTSGAGYQRVDGAMELKPGDAAIAAPDAQASLIYDDGCVVDVKPGMVAWIEPTSPCAAGLGRTRDPDPTLSAPRAFDPAWLVDGAALIKRNKIPAGP